MHESNTNGALHTLNYNVIRPNKNSSSYKNSVPNLT